MLLCWIRSLKKFLFLPKKKKKKEKKKKKKKKRGTTLGELLEPHRYIKL